MHGTVYGVLSRNVELVVQFLLRDDSFNAQLLIMAVHQRWRFYQLWQTAHFS